MKVCYISFYLKQNSVQYLLNETLMGIYFFQYTKTWLCLKFDIFSNQQQFKCEGSLFTVCVCAYVFICMCGCGKNKHVIINILCMCGGRWLCASYHGYVLTPNANTSWDSTKRSYCYFAITFNGFQHDHFKWVSCSYAL